MTLQKCLSNAIEFLKPYSDSPSLDSKILIKEVCSLEDTDFIIRPDSELSEENCKEIQDCLEERKSGLPVAYITGHKDFYRYTFYTPKGVLIPRPDTEVLVEKAVELISKNFKKEKISILDLCAGTGCIGISTALEIMNTKPDMNIKLYLSDIDREAYNCFCVNAENLLWGTGVEVFCNMGDLFENLEDEKFDFILTNPPYIESSIIPTLSKEVQTEPVTALDGGKDGLCIIKKIIKQAPYHLLENGFLLTETGFDQANITKQLFTDAGFSQIEIIKDYANNDRVIAGQRVFQTVAKDLN